MGNECACDVVCIDLLTRLGIDTKVKVDVRKPYKIIRLSPTVSSKLTIPGDINPPFEKRISNTTKLSVEKRIDSKYESLQVTPESQGQSETRKKQFLEFKIIFENLGIGQVSGQYKPEFESLFR